MDDLLALRSPAARIWVFSDLQQSMPDMAEGCLDIALQDVKSLNLSPDAIWYLGDAMEGRDQSRIDEMIRMQVKKLSALGIPLRFVMGNHDLDCTTRLPAGTQPVLPAWEAFRNVPGWKTTPSPSDFYFTETYGDVLVVFLSDHIAPDNRWIATQQEVRGPQPDAYDIPLSAYQDLRDYMASWQGPVILVGHYAFPGGARGAPEDGLLTRLLPLPDTVKLALHGHAHIGDWPYGKGQTYQRIGWIDWHNIPQVNVSSLDRTRGSQTRSVFLDIHADGTLGLFFRDHEDQMWSDVFYVNACAPRSRTGASARHHAKRTDISGTPLGAWTRQNTPQ
jgi:calcineurin-like phosphoesterase family protein